MMNNRIRNTFEKITPTYQQKARMLAGIERETAAINAPVRANTGRKVLRIAAVAAALCCVFGMTAFAEEIGSLFNGLFVKDEIVAQTVLTGVYNDNDGHVNMAVEELLSDGMAVHMVVRYQAIDKQGMEWMNNLSNPNDTAESGAFFGLKVWPAIKDWNTAEYGVNWGWNAYELEELRTETERCFVASMSADRSGWGTDDVEFTYTMTDGEKTTLLNIVTDIEKKVIAMDAPEDSDKLYAPLKATLTPLSIVIEGKHFGLIENGTEYTEDGYTIYQRVTAEEKVDSLVLYFTDGTRVDLLAPTDIPKGIYIFDSVGELCSGAWTLCAGNQSSDDDTIIIAGSHFGSPIDITTVAGFELDGVYYSFE